MLHRLRAWLAELLYRFHYDQGVKFAQSLLCDGWAPSEMRSLPELCPCLMPNAAYVDGFYAALHKVHGLR